MAILESYQALARYNTWMNRRIYALCREKLTDEERKRDMKAFFKSIHGTLHHILSGDRIWLGRFTGDPDRFVFRNAAGEVLAKTAPATIIHDAFEELTREREKTDADILAFVETLDEARLDAPFRYQTLRGDAFEHPMWWAVTHFFNHQTHHRGQVTTLLMQLGHDPGVTDFVALYREEQGA